MNKVIYCDVQDFVKFVDRMWRKFVDKLGRVVNSIFVLTRGLLGLMFCRKREIELVVCGNQYVGKTSLLQKFIVSHGMASWQHDLLCDCCSLVGLRGRCWLASS